MPLWIFTSAKVFLFPIMPTIQFFMTFRFNLLISLVYFGQLLSSFNRPYHRHFCFYSKAWIHFSIFTCSPWGYADQYIAYHLFILFSDGIRFIFRERVQEKNCIINLLLNLCSYHMTGRHVIGLWWLQMVPFWGSFWIRVLFPFVIHFFFLGIYLVEKPIRRR